MRSLPLLAAICVVPGLLSACSLFEGGALGRKYVVFFPSGSAARAADAAANNPALNVLVAGYAAAHGSLTADEALSSKRAEVVASALRADGVAANRIQLSPRSPSNENSAVAARRVEIDFSN